MPISAEPRCSRMILHGAEWFVVIVEPDREFLKILDLGFREDVLDTLQMVGQCIEDLFFKFSVLLLK